MVGPRPNWWLIPVAVGWAGLLGAIVSHALPHDLSSGPGWLWAVWVCGAIAAALNAMLIVGVLRLLGWRIDRPAATTAEPLR